MATMAVHTRLLRTVWGRGHDTDVGYVCVAARSIRRKLEGPAWAIGWRWGSAGEPARQLCGAIERLKVEESGRCFGAIRMPKRMSWKH